jgi:hypothetical protein
MESDIAVGTITQVLSIYRRYADSRGVSLCALENALNHVSALIGDPQPDCTTAQTSSCCLATQNFRIILRPSRIVKECPAL